MPDVTDRLGPDAVPALVRLCRRALPDDGFSDAELGAALFDGDPPAVVRGAPDVGVVASVRRRGGAYLRLLAVDPDHRRQGVATALVRAAEADLAGAGDVTVGTDAPDYLFPGVESTQIGALCLFEKLGYRRTDTNFNMDVDLTRLPPRPDRGADPAGPGDGPELEPSPGSARGTSTGPGGSAR
jgi:ribosomal protein S18 acetylase RimI-like enzyme